MDGKGTTFGSSYQEVRKSRVREIAGILLYFRSAGLEYNK